MTIDAERLEAAADWHRRKQDGVTEGDAVEFARWIAVAENKAVYGQVTRAWAAFDDSAATEVERLRRDTRQRLQRRRFLRNITRIAATVVVAVGAGTIYWSSQGDTYANDGPRPTVIALEDGSSLTLDSKSKVTVRYSQTARRLDLQRGQAGFTVAHDASKPFVVKVGDGSVTALGTSFNINRWGDGATVVLIDGKVRVDSGQPGDDAILAPGQRVTVQGDRLSPVGAADMAAVAAWRNGLLMFDDERLVEALASVNRHGELAVRLSDPSLGDLRISGLFRAGDTDAFYRGVASLHGLEAKVGTKEITLQRRS
jgi:transmembrane sensor